MSRILSASACSCKFMMKAVCASMLNLDAQSKELWPSVWMQIDVLFMTEMLDLFLLTGVLV